MLFVISPTSSLNVTSAGSCGRSIRPTIRAVALPRRSTATTARQTEV